MNQILGTVEKWFIKIVQLILIVVFSTMIFLVAAQVVMRYIGRNILDMSWSEELTRFLLCYMVFFGTVLVYADHGHVWVDNLVNSVPAFLRKVMLLLSYVIQIVFFIVVFVGTRQFMPIAATQYSNVIHIPLDIVYSGIPVTAAFSLVFCIRDIILLLQGRGDLKNE